MVVELTGQLSLGLFWLALGIAAAGYFIGEGLKNFKNPVKKQVLPQFIQEKDLVYYIGLNRKEIAELIEKYPDLPKVELNGKTYYSYQQLIEWFSTKPESQNIDLEKK